MSQDTKSSAWKWARKFSPQLAPVERLPQVVEVKSVSLYRGSVGIRTDGNYILHPGLQIKLERSVLDVMASKASKTTTLALVSDIVTDFFKSAMEQNLLWELRWSKLTDEQTRLHHQSARFTTHARRLSR